MSVESRPTGIDRLRLALHEPGDRRGLPRCRPSHPIPEAPVRTCLGASSSQTLLPAAPSWARLISRVFQADPLVCKRCGGPLEVVAYITDTVAIRRLLDHLGLSPPEKPPPEVREVVRVPVDEGREIADNPV